MPQNGMKMAETGMTPETTGGLLVAVYAAARGLEAGVSKMFRWFKSKDERDEKAKADAAVMAAINNVQKTVEDHKERSHAEHTETRESLARINQQLKEGDRRIGRISDKVDKHLEGHK